MDQRPRFRGPILTVLAQCVLTVKLPRVAVASGTRLRFGLNGRTDPGVNSVSNVSVTCRSASHGFERRLFGCANANFSTRGGHCDCGKQTLAKNLQPTPFVSTGRSERSCYTSFRVLALHRKPGVVSR